jgi:hypothetical protein
VALNYGIGSSCLNAEVKAFDKFQRFRGVNSSYCGSKYKSCTLRAKCWKACAQQRPQRMEWSTRLSRARSRPAELCRSPNRCRNYQLSKSHVPGVHNVRNTANLQLFSADSC